MMKPLTIGQLAKMSGVATRTIRYYEQVGVLSPAKRTPAGYRQYEQLAVERLRFVRRARALGLPLRHLEKLCATLDGSPRQAFRPRLLEFVREQLAAVQQQMDELELLKRQLEEAVDRLLTSPHPGAGGNCRCLEVENGSRPSEAS
jgi:MerR family transcriptional regulator, copper efflux regulator